jgi:hypothetical protein
MGVIRHRISSTTGAIPSAASLVAGELAVNTADGKLFTKIDSGSVVQIGYSGAPSFNGSSAYTGSSTAIDLVNRIGQVIRVTPAIYTPFTSPNANILLPNNSTTPIPVGATFFLVQVASGQTVFSPDTGVTLRSRLGSYLGGLDSSALLVKANTNSWALIGDLVP